MKKKITRAIAVLFTVAALLSLLCVSVSAAVTEIRFTDPSVYTGGTVTVTMYVRHEVAGYEVYLSYDSELLEYVGTDSRVQGGGGTLFIMQYDIEQDDGGAFQVPLTFRALKAGVANITVSQQEVAGYDGDIVTDVACGNSKVTIANPPTASSDSSLKALTVSPGTLSPQFSPGTTDYSVTVSSGTTQLAVSATANHSKATVNVTGKNNLQVGTNLVTVTVTAEDGSKTNYSIKVTRNASVTSPPPVTTPTVTASPEEPEAYVILPDGSTAKVANKIPQEKIPVGFDLSKTTVDEVEVPAIVYHENGLPAVYLNGDNKVKAGFYFVNPENGTAAPMESMSSELSLILLDVNLAEIPQGYEAGKFTFGETERDALVPAGVEEPDHCLVYGMNADGVSALYRYDSEEETFQRYMLPVIGEEPPADPTPTPEATPTPAPTPSPVQGETDGIFSGEYMEYLCIALTVLMVLFLILTILFATLYEKKASAFRALSAKKQKEEKIDPELELEMMFGHNNDNESL